MAFGMCSFLDNFRASMPICIYFDRPQELIQITQRKFIDRLGWGRIGIIRFEYKLKQ